MNPVVLAILVLVCVGIAAALLLSLASKYMSVPTDETYTKIRACLPGANCGGCGYAGCDGYAAALAEGTEEKCNKCSAGGNDVAEALALACGREFEAAPDVKAFVHCRGTCEHTQKVAERYGKNSCKAAKITYGGEGACVYGCLGYGDCAEVCPQECINLINGVAHVNQGRCIGCGACERTCPNKIISLIPSRFSMQVACSNKEKGAVARKKCTAACIGCGICQKKCEYGAITVVNNVAVIDYDKCQDCGTCKTVCPQKAIF